MADRSMHYAAIKPRETDWVETVVRGSVWDRLDPPESYDKVEPHVTVHPGFTCDQRTVADIAGVLARLLGEKMVTNGVKFYPSRDEPIVVMLGVDIDLSVYQHLTESMVRAEGGTVDREPVPPHITLFKAADAGEDHGELIADEAALEEIEGSFGGVELTVGGHYLEKCG